MKRSEINALVRDATACFEEHGWAMPPEPRWDVTDFGLGDMEKWGLVLLNLAEEPEYCEKLMYAKEGMVTPAHYHKRKKEDIICRWGVLGIQVWSGDPVDTSGEPFSLKINGEIKEVLSGDMHALEAGERVTLEPGAHHEFSPASPEVILGEVSTANDDRNDNFFVNPNIGRFPEIEEDVLPIVKLVSEP